MPADRQPDELDRVVERLRADVARIEETPFERLRRVHADLMGTNETGKRPPFVLIRGGRDDAS